MAAPSPLPLSSAAPPAVNDNSCLLDRIDCWINRALLAAMWLEAILLGLAASGGLVR